MNIIAFINQKGGVGKSTITMNMASYLTNKGKKVLTIDLDPQGNTSQAYGIDTSGKATLREVLLGEISINKAIYGTRYGYMIPSDIALGHSERQIAGALGCETLLKKAINPFFKAIKGTDMDLDYVLIDCPPAFNVFTYNALNIATDVVLPCRADEWSYQAVQQFLVIKQQMIDSFDKDFNIAGVIINQFQSNITTQKTYYERFKDFCKEENINFISQTIRQSTDINTAIANSQSVFDYKPKSLSAQDMEKALVNILENIKGDK